MINLRLAFRSLIKTPLVSIVAIFSLALGVGANAAIFSIFERIILRSLPVEEPERLVNILGPGPKSGSQSTNDAGGIDAVFSYPMFRDLEAADTALSGIAAHRSFGANLAYQGNTLSTQGMLVSGSYFEVLGLRPVLGRLFNPSDDLTPGAHPVVVLDHTYWQTYFDSDPEVLGKSLIVNGHPMTILGVAPPKFSGTTLGSDPRIYVPISMRGITSPGWDGFESRRSYWIYLFGRLKPGVSEATATASINVPYRGIIQDVELELQRGMSDRGLERFKNKEIVLESGRRGQSGLHKDARVPLLLLLGVTGFVLLIACANLANLLLIKATNRASEIAVRMSIGARRSQVMGQLLTESFVLAALGSVVGLLVAQLTLRFFGFLMPSDGPGFELELSSLSWIFMAVLTVITGLAGLFPAIHSTRSDLVLALKSQAGRTSASKTANRFRASMATFQIALSMALLVAAGLFVKSLLNVSRVDLGIEVASLATFSLSPELNKYTPVESRGLFARVEEEVAALPGVTRITASLVPLISGSNWGSNVSVQGFPDGPDVDTHSNYNEVGTGYFKALGIAILAGREFTPADTLEQPKVALVNEAFAKKFNLGREAVGKRMQVGSGGEFDIEIVGLVKDAKYSEVKRAVPPLFFLPYRQNDDVGSINFYVRAAGDPEQLLTSLRTVVSRLDPALPIDGLRTMESQVRENVFVDHMLSTLSAAFATLATVLAAIGLYGVLGYSVAQRRREIGLRMALGADAGRVRRLVLRQVGWMTVIGAVVGTAAALGLGRLASSLLFEVEGQDPMVLVASVALLATVALVAGLAPAQRAASINPVRALREE